MKKVVIFSGGALLVLAIVLVPTSSARAATTCPTGTQPVATETGGTQCLTPSQATVFYNGYGISPGYNTCGFACGLAALGAAETTGAVSSQVSDAQNSAANVKALQQASQVCGLGNLWKCLTDWVAWVLGWIVDVVYWTFLWLVWVSAEILDFCVQQLVLNMGTYINSTAAQGVQTAWGIVRDLANIGIVGGMVAIAIGTILQLQNYTANKLLARLIIAAILINFSYFFAGTIIDASNYLAAAAYNKATTATGCGVGDCTLTLRFVEVTNFQSMHDDLASQAGYSGTLAAVNQAAETAFPSNPWKTLWIDILSVIFELITIFVFLSAAALLLGRFVSLIFLLISSPIGIAGMAVPLVNRYVGIWWRTLFAQAFFAPIYFLLMYFSFLVLENAKSVIAQSTGTNNAVGTMLTFLVASAFMLVSLKAAKKMSEVGKDYLGEVYKGAGYALGWMPRTYTRALPLLGTETVGRAGYRLGEFYRDNIAPLRFPNNRFFRSIRLGGKMMVDVPGLASIDRGIQSGLKGTATAKFGGGKEGPSFESTKAARDARLKVVGEKRRELDQKKKGEEAHKVTEEREAEALEEIEEGQRRRIPVEGGPATSSTGSGGGGGTPRGGGGGPRPAATRIPEAGPGGSRTPTSGGTEGGGGPRPAATRIPEAGPGGSRTPTSGGTGPGVRAFPTVASLDAEGEATRAPDEGLLRQALDSHRTKVQDSSGRERLETDHEVMARLKIDSAERLIVTDADTGQKRIKSGLEIARDVGNAAKLSVQDRNGNVREETPEELQARLDGHSYANYVHRTEN